MTVKSDKGIAIVYEIIEKYMNSLPNKEILRKQAKDEEILRIARITNQDKNNLKMKFQEDFQI